MSTNNNNRKGRKVRRTRRGGVNVSRVNAQSLANMRVPIPKSLRVAAPIPSRMSSKLKLTYTTVLQDAVNSFAKITFKANDWYSPNNLLVAPSSLTGFPMLSSGYMQWRVDSCKARYSVISNEPAHGVTHAMGFTDSDPSGITTLVLQRALLGRQPVTKLESSGQTTAGAPFMSAWQTIKMASIVGNPILYYGSQGFTGVGGPVPASPAQLLYFFFLLFNPIGTPLTNGANVTIEIEYSGEFFSIANNF